MTIYGTPGGTPLNTSGFQGTSPGTPVQATLQVVNPGVGLFPPNATQTSVDSIMASASRAACPLNVSISNFGVTEGRNQVGAQGGRAVLEALGTGEANGTSSAFVNNGGSANAGPAGGAGPGGGGYNQTNGPGSGESIQLPASGPSSLLNIAAQPAYRG